MREAGKGRKKVNGSNTGRKTRRARKENGNLGLGKVEMQRQGWWWHGVAPPGGVLSSLSAIYFTGGKYYLKVPGYSVFGCASLATGSSEYHEYFLKKHNENRNSPTSNMEAWY